MGTTGEGRRRLETDARRQQLLDVGLELYASRGFVDVPIDEIAKVAGISKGLLYHYFDGKRGFYLAVLDHAADRVLDVLAFDPELAPAEQAVAGIRAFVDLMARQQVIYRALTWGRGDPDMEARIRRVQTAILDLVMASLYGPGRRFEDARPALRLALHSWIVSIEGGVLDWAERRDLDVAEVTRYFAEQLRSSVRMAASLDPNLGLDFKAHPGLRPAESG